MRVFRDLCVLFMIVAPMKLHMCAEGLKQFGIVTDEQSRTRIAGALVIAGAKAVNDAITDAKGTFSLTLVDGIKSGEIIRIRVQKEGYLAHDEEVAVSELPLQISLTPIKKPHESSGRSAGPTAPTQPVPIVALPPTPKDNVRDQGLALSKEILDFLAERERNDPHPEQAPPESGASQGGASQHGNMTPKYMQETLVLFGNKFESKIADIHDEFASRGLHDSTLDLLYRNPGYNMFGNNADAAIRDISRNIHNLALLIPPAGLYKDVSDAQLAQMAIDEANKMDEMTDEAMKRLETSPSPDSERFFFGSDFRSCCLDQVEYLRSELMKRLGPYANDTDEMREFNGSFGFSFTEMEKNPSASIRTVLVYSPLFRRLAIKMKRKATPLSGPRALTYSETQVASEKPTIPYKMVVTIETKTDLLSGYVFLQFMGRYASMRSDFADAKILIDGRDVIDDPELERLLNPTMPVFALKIGRTPFLSSRPIHVVVEAPEQIRVAKALFFDE
jgi:hypothetical protein